MATRVLRTRHKHSLTIVASGWGAAVALMLMRRRPRLVKRLVVAELAWCRIGRGHTTRTTGWQLLGKGLLYQYWLGLCFLLQGLPYVGNSVADWLCQKSTPWIFGPDRPLYGAPSHARECYFYFYAQLGVILEALRRKLPFDRR